MLAALTEKSWRISSKRFFCMCNSSNREKVIITTEPEPTSKLQTQQYIPMKQHKVSKRDRPTNLISKAKPTYPISLTNGTLRWCFTNNPFETLWGMYEGPKWGSWIAPKHSGIQKFQISKWKVETDPPTLIKINKAPTRRPGPKKKTHLPTLVFQVPAVSLRESGNFWSTQSPMWHLKIWLDHPRCTDSSRSDQHNLPNSFERKKKRAQRGISCYWMMMFPPCFVDDKERFMYNIYI